MRVEPLPGCLLSVAASYELCWVQGCHDCARVASRYDPDRALALTTLALGLPGTPFLYQGNEVGLINGHVSADQAQDPLICRGGSPEHNRDPARIPMPRLPSPGLGFTTAEQPWILLGDRRPSDSVTAQADDARSMLQAHRRLRHLRRLLPDLPAARPTWLPTPEGVSAYRSGETIVAANLAMAPLDWIPPGSWRVRYSTHHPVRSVPVTLAVNEALILTQCTSSS